MADVNDFPDYPKGKCSLGAGDLIDVFDINFSYADGEKVLATLRQNPAGSTGGSKSCSATFKAYVSHAGFERDWMGKYSKREVVELRLKIPGITFTIVGRLTNPNIVANVDNAVEFTVTIVGKGGHSPV